MPNLQALDHSNLITKPFKYSVINGFLSNELVKTLLEALPKNNYFRSTRHEGSDKTYNVVNNLLLKLGDKSYNQEANLPAPWIELVTTIASQNYLNALSILLDEDLYRCHLEITLKRYGYGDFISSHTDTKNVRATHMIFLNETWDESWGGGLCLMNDDQSVFERFFPSATKSIAFVRAENSWHSVDKIINHNAERIAMQVAFWNIKDRKVLAGRIEEVADIY